MENLRKIDRQNIGQAVYRVPSTDHWAGWMEADAVAYHGKLIALKNSQGKWVDADGDPVDTEDARMYGRLRSVGISTR